MDSVQLNNAGVQLLSIGREYDALEHFRNALRSKLTDGSTLNRVQNGPTVINVRTDGASNENPRTVTGTTATEEPLSSTRPLAREPMGGHQIRSSSSNYGDAVTIPLQSRGYDPYVYDTPFPLVQEQSEMNHLASAVIVFNLGLVHQSLSRTSHKAAAFYEIAAALLVTDTDSTDPFMLLRVALLNNFGIWCYENGHGESMRTCIEHLSSILQESPDVTSAEMRRKLLNNVLWLLTPPFGASPAA